MLSMLVGPFAAFIDGRYTIGILGSNLSVLLAVAIPTVLGGLLGGLLMTRLSPRLSIATEVSRMDLKASPIILVKPVDQNAESVGSR